MQTRTAITLTIANVSHRDITAYNITVKETYADGRKDSSELMTDLVGALAVISPPLPRGKYKKK